MAAGFVQKQDFRFAVKGACQYHTLLLPTAQYAAHVANQRFKAHRHRGDFVMDIRHTGAMRHFRHIGRIVKKADVFGNGAGKQNIVLHHRCAITAHKGGRQGVNIVSAQQDSAACRFQAA